MYLGFCMMVIWPITVDAQSKAWAVFGRSNTAIMVSNPTWGIVVCVRLLCVCATLCAGSGLATGWSPIQGFQPTMYRLRNWKGGQDPQRAVEPQMNERLTEWMLSICRPNKPCEIFTWWVIKLNKKCHMNQSCKLAITSTKTGRNIEIKCAIYHILEIWSSRHFAQNELLNAATIMPDSFYCR
jgi:hypothetical protein